MVNSRIKISSVVQNQVPDFVREDYPLFVDFLKQYYISLESDGSTLDLLQNIDQYIKVDRLTNLIESTTISSDISFSDSTINVSSTSGFPKSYGLIQIDNEIITYTGKTSTSFTGCIRGFSGVTSLEGTNTPDQLVFSESKIEEHTSGSTVINLSILFLQEFLTKVKKQVTPGFEGRTLYSGLNENLFIKQSKDFYVSKGTEESFKILFRVLYGQEIEVIRPSDYLFKPSDAQYRVTRDLVVEAISGDPKDLLNRTLFQDETENFGKASGSINNVQSITRDGKEYYIISLDYDFDKDINVKGSVSGQFSVHSNTHIVRSVSIGSSIIDVDSTIGFPSSGSLVATLSNGTDVNIDYTSKTYNQFFGCSGITQIIPQGQFIRYDAYAYGYSGIGTENVVKVRITGVLSDLRIEEGSKLYDENETIKIKNLGATLKNIKSNDWLFNIASTYNVESTTLLNSSNNSYTITTYDDNDISVGDRVKIIQTDGTEVLATVFVSGINNKKSFSIKGQSPVDIARVDKVRREISRANSTNYPEVSAFTTNIQNVYVESEKSESTVYVASPSIPNYFEQPLNIKDRSVTFSGSFNGTELTIPNHGFYTGDAVVYRPSNSNNTLGIEEGTFFVKKINNDTIRLSRSRNNIDSGIYVTFSGTVTNDKLEYLEFSYQKLSSQKLIRKISDPIDTSSVNETEPGAIGILVNGVEILNYKSKNSVFYGPIENIIPVSGGSSYDVINPPELTISDNQGSGASAFCSVEGALERIDIIDGGFDYLNTPTITIIGGNGSGAIAKPNMTFFSHEVPFNASSSAGLVDLSNNTIAFSTFHKFRDYERVIYRPDNQTPIAGLTTNSSYYVSVQDEFTVKLHKKYEDAVLGTNPINITSYGDGTQLFQSYNAKKKIGSISIVDPGSGYRNRKVSTPSTGINTSFNLINIPNHGYETGEIISYTSPATPAGVLSDNSSYYVAKIDDNNFRLHSVGVGSTAPDFYYNTNQYVDLSSSGVGIHTFNYQPITISVSGIIGVSTLTGQDFNAVLTPIFRGEIYSTFVENGGTSYGSPEIINYNRQPRFALNSGSGAQLLPIVVNGQIAEVLVVSPGSGYNSSPDLVVGGSGYGAVLSPVISNGQISEVKVVNNGIGYLSSDTTVTVVAAGSGAELYSTPKEWKINIVERLIETGLITDDDGVIDNGLNNEYGLQYTHAYSPRKLRQIVLGTKYVNGVLTYQPDLRIVNNIEIVSDAHSPIIGWAYDGNPIYGPYGYDTPTGGSIRSMVSGYEITSNSDRPSYPQGFFVNDYEYTGNGDLDEYNGRFCITPEFPNGVYAYFTTISNGAVESALPFKNYKKPVFPYFVGNQFKSSPINFNYLTASNQDSIDAGEKSWLRNTTPYNFGRENSFYSYIIDPNEIKEQNSTINFTSKSGISTVQVLDGGNNYQVSDVINFNEENTQGFGAYAEVSRISGKTVSQISVANTSVSYIEFAPFGPSGQFIGLSTEPHNFKNLDVISLGGLSTSILNQEDFYTIGVSTNTFVLSNDVPNVPSTGIVTYFSVFGALTYPFIKENDILQINSEKVKVLNVDQQSSRIRVVRSYGGSVGQAHTSSDVLYEDSSKFTFSSEVTKGYEFNINKSLYFSPEESLGLGTSYGVGIGTTITFSNPGVGITEIFIPTKSIYFPNHQLETGVELIYSSGNGDPVSISTDGLTSSQLTEGQTLYAAKISKDLIGLSTERVGLGSTGSFVGINSSITVDTLFFTGIGTGSYHSLKTNFSNVLTGTAFKNTVTVSTASTHGLSVNDSIDLEVISGLSTTIVVSYNQTLNKLAVNPISFSSGNVNASNNTITLVNHNLSTGNKVIHTSSSPSGGLLTNREYYVIVVDQNNIKLSDTYYNSVLENPLEVNITSSSSGTLSLVNPKIEVYKNQTVVFDVSDSSLLYSDGSQNYAAFDFKLFTDSEFKNEFISTKSSEFPEVVKNGTIGVSTNASVSLRINDIVPNNLFYNLVPSKDTNNPNRNISILVDNENIISNNLLTISNSLYAGIHLVSGITSTTFDYNIRNYPEKSLYTSSNATITYTTNSNTSYGPISEVYVSNKGKLYNYLPGIGSVTSDFGSGAILLPHTDSIGKVVSTRIEDIGFDYPSDKTLRPVAKLPQIIKVEPLASFDRIGISSQGIGYVIAPELITIDSSNNKVISDVVLEYQLGDNQVSIIKNTTGINNVLPIILPVNNSNGIGISTISYDNVSGDVTVQLNVGFSTLSSFPFSVGDKVLVENISIGVNSTGKGYNSRDYNYQLFTINSIDPNIGGIGATVGYNLSQYLSGSEFPGNFDLFNSFGRIIPEKHFPIFDISLKKNSFFDGESVVSDSSTGILQSYDEKNDYINVSSNKEFKVGEVVKGQSSDTQGIITNIISPYSEYSLSSSSIVRKGWNLNTGFLNDSIQRLHDNDYYQYFSYSIKSKVEYEEWNNPVSNLNHTTGFKKFSDLIVEGIDETGTAGITTSQDGGDFVGLNDLISTIDLECVNDFDIATENTFAIGANQISTEIVLNSREIQDYFESIGNRVLIIDDVSQSFNSNPRPTRYSIVDTFLLSDARYRKIFSYVRDKRYYDERQLSIISILHDNFTGYINSYGRVDTINTSMGSYDFVVSGTEGNILFYPEKYAINDYDVSTVSYSIKDSVAGVGTTSFGDVVYLNTSQTTVPAGLSTSQTIVGIATTFRSTKLLLEISDNSSYYEINEMTVIHDGFDVLLLDYGQLTSTLGPLASTGIGTYSANIVGSNLNIDLYPDSALTSNYEVNTFQVRSGTGAGSTTPNNIILNGVDIGSEYVSIASSTSPIENIVLTRNSVDESTTHTDAVYIIATVEDITNGQYQVSELNLVTNSTDSFLTEYAVLETGSGIGTFGANIVGSDLQVYFTPIANSDVQVRLFYNTLSEIDPVDIQDTVDLNNSLIETSYGTYEGTERDVRRAFNLTHKGNNIFRKVFDGSDSSIVNLTENTIRIPNHFFVTGEEIVYSHNGNGEAISIATTTIPGIGSTDILPPTLYAVKVDELDIKVAASSSEALSVVPNVLDLTSVGIGTNHVFTAKNQNSKVLISIDNMIQSPVVSTAITSSLLSDFRIIDNTAYFTGITSFFGGDLIKIGDEIMKIESVGFGSDLAVLVQRPWMGTGISSHIAGSTITKIDGNYNIVGNTVNFYEAPYGPIPIGSVTNPPDQRDYVGITTYSTFSGRSFLRSGVPGGSEETYTKNYIFDSISNEFNGITTQFTLKSNGNDVSGISTGNAIVLIKDIFQEPQRLGVVDINGDYTLSENLGITTISFTGDSSQTPYDINNSSIPVGGQIVSVGSTAGLAYQPLVSAGGTAVISIAGTVQSISIGNSGSGYRSGIQTVNVGVASTSLGNYDIQFVGVASVLDGHVVGVSITNPGTGHTFTEPPFVIFDSPLSYSNIPLIYSSSSPAGGLGTEAKIDIVVGQGSSVIDFNITNTGYGYGQGEILTVAIGGTVGIPTDPTKSFGEFRINVEKTYSMEFNAMTIGDLQVLDKIENEFNGEEVKFALRSDNIRYSIKARSGSNIDINATLLIFINDILQVPGESYTVNGSTLTFSEAPKSGDTCKIIFYKGTGDIDVSSVDNLETIKIGDSVQLNDYENINYQQNPRIATSIEATDIIGTNPYSKPGVNWDKTYERPLNWCRQRNDKVVNGQFVSKDRIIYEPLINPTSYLIQPVSTNDTEIYVDNVYTFFNSEDENPTTGYQNKIRIISQDERVGASATAIVSAGGSVTSIVLNDGGVGYTTAPTVSISNPAYSTGVLTYDIGTVESISYTEFGAGSMTSQYSGDVDDTYFVFDLPTPISFLGGSYSRVYLSSNGYLTFGSFSTQDSGLTYNSPSLPKIHIYVGDRRVQNVYVRTILNSFRVRVEGYDFGSSATLTPYVYELEINPNYIDINYVNVSDSPEGGIGDGVNPFIGTWSTLDTTSYRVYTTNYTLTGIITASATASITSGIVTSFNITNNGIGYTSSNPPSVLIEPPSPIYEDISNVTYSGDFGVISGISTTSVGVASTGIVFDLYIPGNSFLRDTDIVGTAVTVSGISTGDYFVVRNSNVGNGVTSLYSNGSNLGIGTENLDNVYEVAAVSIAQTDAVGYGNTYVAKVTVSLTDYNGLSGIGYSNFFGEYSWGKITANQRTNPLSFDWYNNGLVGVSTSPVLNRTNPLKYLNYNS